MLPLQSSWYRKLLAFSLILGIAGGIGALLFFIVVVGGSGISFGSADIGWWSGQWWWILLTAFGGLAVAFLRKRWAIAEEVPGSIALAHQAWVDPNKAPYWVLLSAISLLSGASLGPSFALIVLGGAMGSWAVSRFAFATKEVKAEGENADEKIGEEKAAEEEAKQEFTLAGMAGSMGAAFSAPLFAGILTSELSPTRKRNYVAAILPQLLAATLGFVIFFGVTGSSMLGSYELPA